MHAVPNTLHSHGLMTPLSTSPHWHALGSATRTPGTVVAQLGVERGELGPQLERALRDEPEAAPFEVRPQLEHLGRAPPARAGCPRRARPACTGSRPRNGPRGSAPAAWRSPGGCRAARSRRSRAACRTARRRTGTAGCPTTVDTCPGPRNPSRRRSGDSRIALIGGTIVTWLQNTRKFVDAELARLEQRERGRRRRRLEPDGEEHDVAGRGVSIAIRNASSGEYTKRTSAPRGLRLQQVAVAARDTHHVAERREDHARCLGDGDRVVDPTHRDDAHRAARARARARRSSGSTCSIPWR